MSFLWLQGNNEKKTQNISEGRCRLRAEIEIECEEPETVIKSLEPDVEKINRFEVEFKTDKNKILLIVKSDDLGGLLAGINSYVRLIKAATDAMRL